MRTTIGIESLRRYLKCTSIALQHAYQHTVCSRADVGRRRVNPNADRVSRVAHAPLCFGRLDTIAAAPPTRHAAPNSMPFDDLAARREPDRFSATMRAALQTPHCEPSRRNPLPTCTSVLARPLLPWCPYGPARGSSEAVLACPLPYGSPLPSCLLAGGWAKTCHVCLRVLSSAEP